MSRPLLYDSGIHLLGIDPKYDRAATPDKQVATVYDARPLPLRRVARRDDLLASVSVSGDVSPYTVPADALRIYLTGADSDAGEQTDVNASLGGFRSRAEAERIGRIIARGLGGVRVGLASGRNGVEPFAGGGSLLAAGRTRVRYLAPGSEMPGPDVRMTPGVERTVVDGEDPSRWVRATLLPAEDPDDDLSLSGAATIEFVEQFGRLFGFGDDEDAGEVVRRHYRAAILRAAGARVERIRAWVGVLGAEATSDASHLPASGGGELAAADPDAFASWPHKGWCRIEHSNGELREIVYYAGRTDGVLTVPDGGRGLLGTSAADGAVSDKLFAIPPIRIGFEHADPLSGGAIQQIGDAVTEPTAIAWSTAIRPNEGLGPDTLRNREHLGLWIERELGPATAPFSRYEIQIELAWTCLDEECRETLRGLFRVGSSALDRYELRAAAGYYAPIDRNAPPLATATNLPFVAEHEFTPGIWTVVVDRRNRYDLMSRSSDVRVLTISEAVEIVADPPSAPELQDLQARSGGTIFAIVAYLHRRDDPPADEWLVYVAIGRDPDVDVDLPIVTAIDAGNALAIAAIDCGPFTPGDEVRCLVRVRRAVDGQTSASSEILTVVAADHSPGDVGGDVYFGIGPAAAE